MRTPATAPPSLFPLLPLLLPVLLLVSCVSGAGAPEPLKVGSRIARSMLYDQNEVPHRIDESVKVIFFAREMEGGKVIRALLEQEGPDFLEKHKALYVADISDMPRLIANMIAIPKMRDERPYPTLLDRDGEVTASFPSEEGRVTILRLDALKVTAVAYRGSVGGLREAASKR